MSGFGGRSAAPSGGLWTRTPTRRCHCGAKRRAVLRHTCLPCNVCKEDRQASPYASTSARSKDYSGARVACRQPRELNLSLEDNAACVALHSSQGRHSMARHKGRLPPMVGIAQARQGRGCNFFNIRLPKLRISFRSSKRRKKGVVVFIHSS